MDRRLLIRYARLRLPCAAAVVALMVGFLGWLIKWLIQQVTSLVMTDFNVAGGNWWLLFTPVVGICIGGWLVRNVVRMPLDRGTERIKADISSRDGVIPVRVGVWSLLLCAMTLGFGGSAGAEGPMARIGATVGSKIARMFRLSRSQWLILLCCGAGAGIAAIFKAPVGGMLFTIEALHMSMGVSSCMMLISMCLVSAMTAYLLSGCLTDMVMPPVVAFDTAMLPGLLLLGLFGGIYSVYYMRAGRHVRTRLLAISCPLLRNAVAGLTIGVLIFLFPALYGEGYTVLAQVVNGHDAAVSSGAVPMLLSGGDHLLLTLAGILLCKSIACYATNSGGGVAGTFTPTLFAGGMVGAFVAGCLCYVPAINSVPTDVMVVCGMAAVMSGVIRAPLMTIFLVVEMTHMSQLLLPASVVSAVSYVTSLVLSSTGVGDRIQDNQEKQD